MRDLDTAVTTDITIVVDLCGMAYRAAHAGKGYRTYGRCFECGYEEDCSVSTGPKFHCDEFEPKTDDNGEPMPYGRPSGHIFISVTMIRSLVRQYPGARWVFVFDSGHAKGLLTVGADYKAGRGGRKQALGMVPDYELARLLKGLPCTAAWCPAMEADDVIGTIVRTERGPFIVHTTDKDLWQLIDPPNVQVTRDGKKFIGKAEVEKAFGVGIPPRAIPLHKAIFGDKSDCIPGIPHLLAKPVIPVLATCRTPEQFYKRILAIPSKAIVQRLFSYKEQVESSYKAAVLWNTPVHHYICKPNHQHVRSVLEEFDCWSMLSSVGELIGGMQPMNLTSKVEPDAHPA